MNNKSQAFRKGDGRFVKIRDAIVIGGLPTFGGFKKGVPNGPAPRTDRAKQRNRGK